jgi:hypothetical protein
MNHKLIALAELISRETRERRLKEWPDADEEILSHDCEVKIIPGKKYTKIDVGRSGKYMVDADGNIFGIKAYGVIHRGHHYGTLDTIEEWYWGDYTATHKSQIHKVKIEVKPLKPIQPQKSTMIGVFSSN